MTARKAAGYAVLTAPFVAWFVVFAVLVGPLIVTAIALGGAAILGVFGLGFRLINGGDR